VKALIALLVAGGLCGCAPITLSPPPLAAQSQSPGQTASAARDDPAPAVRQSASATSSDPVDAVVAFATAYINWRADTMAADMRTLARRSIGQARSAVQLASAQAAGDDELARAGMANQGSVQAVGPLAGRSDAYAVVTLERSTAADSTAFAGLAPAWHVAVATVDQVAPGRWVVSGWQPEN
jgi:hypothetical protein